jgi:hypothetical protein
MQKLFVTPYLTRFAPIIAACTALGYGSVYGQDAQPVTPPASNPKPSPKDDPELNRPPVAPRESFPTQPAPSSGPPRTDEVVPVAPTPGTVPQQSVPTLAPARVPAVGGKMLPEGTFVTDRVGKIVMADTGDAVFIPENGDAVVVMLPSQRLEQLLTSRTASGDGTRYRVAGQVFSYRTRTFMLPTMFAPVLTDNIITTPSDVSPPQSVTPPSQSNPTKDVINEEAMKDPRVADLIRDLEGSRTGNVGSPAEPRRLTPNPSAVIMQPSTAIPTSSTANVSQAVTVEQAVVTDAKQATIANEGTILVSKRGRVVRLTGEGGRLGFALDNDPNSPAQPPMILHPCRVMESMEAMASLKGENVSYRVSGRVMVFAGKNYLLPTFYQLVPKGDITPRQ